MDNETKMLAFDFGASSGRAVLGILREGILTLEEIHRFSNDPVAVGESLHWDILRLFHEIRQGIRICANKGHRDISSIAVDTWGVDFGLLDENGDLLGNPYHYRDSLTDGIMDEVFKVIPGSELYKMTGIQFMKFNTVFQLYAMKKRNLPVFREARTVLLTPDLFNYFLTGRKAAEHSIASTTQLLDPKTGGWSGEIMDRLGLPRGIFPDIVPSGTIIGTLLPALASELGLPEIPVIAVASHDTQSAVAAVPSEETGSAYISCGTWSLMGIESDVPIIDDRSFRLEFTNEGGAGNSITFLKNIMGLWLVQESRRQWEREGNDASFGELEAEALASEPFVSFIDPDHGPFMAPGNMPERIREYCRKTGQPEPRSRGETVRCIAQSLAMKYRSTVESLEEICGRELPVIHMVGGGIKDRMLCRFTADATGRKVVAGPVEATATGNLLIQAMALGRIKDLVELREIVRKSFPVTVYEPVDSMEWSAAYERYKAVAK